MQLLQQGQMETGQQLAAHQDVAQYANHVLQASQVTLSCWSSSLKIHERIKGVGGVMVR